MFIFQDLPIQVIDNNLENKKLNSIYIQNLSNPSRKAVPFLLRNNSHIELHGWRRLAGDKNKNLNFIFLGLARVLAARCKRWRHSRTSQMARCSCTLSTLCWTKFRFSIFRIRKVDGVRIHEWLSTLSWENHNYLKQKIEGHLGHIEPWCLCKST